MKAVRLYAPGDLRVEEVPEPASPEAGWVRLTVTAAGICGSDIHNFRTGQWIQRAPSTPGHELAGIVEAVGPGVAGLQPGDAVVADSRFWCGACAACRAGRHHLCEKLGFVGEICDGGFAEQALLPARLLHKVDSDLNPAIAAVAEPLAVALHTAARLEAEQGAPVLVAGCGPIGGLVALVLSRRGHRILVADRNADRARLVSEVTGAAVVDLRQADIEAALGGTRPAACVDATGSAAVVKDLIELVASGGRIALVGIFHVRLDLDPNLLVEREIGLVGCHASVDELPAAIDMLSEIAEPVRRLIDREIGLDEVPDAYRRLVEGNVTGLKTIVRPQPSGSPS